MKAKLLLLTPCPLEPTAVTKDPACHSEDPTYYNWDLTSHINEPRNHLFLKKDYLFIWMKQKMKKNSKATSAMYQTLSTMTRSPLHSGSWRQNRGGGRKAILLFWEAPSQVYHLRPAYLNDSGEKVYMPSIYRLTLGSQCLILHVNCRSSLVLWCLLRSAWGNQTSSNSKLCCLFYSQSLKLRKGKEKKLIRALGISSSWNFPLLET